MSTLKAISELFLILVSVAKEGLELIKEARAYLVKRQAMLEYQKADEKAQKTGNTSDLEAIWSGKHPPAAK
jgi:hypothetical protein